MQTTIEIDDQLLQKAMQDSDDASESAVVAAALRLLIQMRAQNSLRDLRGKIQWDGDLDASRQNRLDR
jgi:Arc/MetJ family transcription regulator